MYHGAAQKAAMRRSAQKAAMRRSALARRAGQRNGRNQIQSPIAKIGRRSLAMLFATLFVHAFVVQPSLPAARARSFVRNGLPSVLMSQELDRRTAVGLGLGSVAAVGGVAPAAAADGNTVTFTVNTLGEVANVVIELHPDWAPKGVEVRHFAHRLPLAWPSAHPPVPLAWRSLVPSSDAFAASAAAALQVAGQGGIL